MKLFKRKNYHEFFEVGVVIKIINGFLEATLGVLIYFISRATFVGIFGPLLRTPLWAFSSHFFHSFSISGKVFWSAYFFLHGATSAFLAIMLLKNKPWAYPTAITVFSIFALYQIGTFIHRPAVVLGVATTIDIIVIGLIINEYR